MATTMTRGSWSKTIGVVGGVGPFAHIDFERRLLQGVGGATSDQSYPEWIVSSIPATPDRTRAILGSGTSPVPQLVQSVERLEAAGADFAVIVCHTAHAFIKEIQTLVGFPLLNLVEEAVTELRETGKARTIGLLATTGTLKSRVYQDAADRIAPELRLLSLLDLPGGEAQQERLVMTPIYGRVSNGERTGGLKSGHHHDPLTDRSHADALVEAAERLADAGAEVVITACTEISLVADEMGSFRDDLLLDPVDVAARETLRIARGDRPLPSIVSYSTS